VWENPREWDIHALHNIGQHQKLFTPETKKQSQQNDNKVHKTMPFSISQQPAYISLLCMSHNTHFSRLWSTMTKTVQQPYYDPLSGTTRVSRYQKKHSPTHHPDHHPIFISFFHLPRSIASSLFKLCARQSFCTTPLHVLFGLPLGLEPSTSYSIHFFTQSVSSFRNTCAYHRNLFCCSINIISPTPSLSFNYLLRTLSLP